MTSLTAPLSELRRRVERDVTGLLTSPERPASVDVHRPAGDLGLFGPESVAWKVHANRCGLVGGLRALLLQTMHPLTMAGVAEHSDYRADPWGRLHRTGGFIGVTTYGSTAAAEAAIAVVRRVHERVQGVAPDGRAYQANDPHLLAWVHDTEVDSFLRAYQRYSGGDLAPAEEDRYVAEMAEVAIRLGVVDPPRTRAQLRQALIAYRPELTATRQARQAVRFLLWPPMPTYLRPAYGVLAAASVGLLPGFVRRELWLPTAPLADPLLVQPATRLLLQGLGATLGSEPPALRLARDGSHPPGAPGPIDAEPAALAGPGAGPTPGEGGLISPAGLPTPTARPSRPGSRAPRPRTRGQSAGGPGDQSSRAGKRTRASQPSPARPKD